MLTELKLQEYTGAVINKSVKLIAAAILLVTIPIWIIGFAPHFKEIPANFSYTANVLALDNFYNEQRKEYEGAHISKTTFNYDVVAANPSYLVIRNTFMVRRLSNEPIFSATRLYDINPKTGEHVAVLGEKKRIGYLFAPRYAGKKDFYYWHVNYDAPALMKFVNEERINYLTVYHYQAQYEADQTKDLEYLAWVPEKYGIKTKVNLQLWIEPISGWLIKYQDNSTAYFYDYKTNKILFPWNSFSNRYTQNSVNAQVFEARKLKWKILLVDFGVPIILGILIILLLWDGFRKNKLGFKKQASLKNNFFVNNRKILTILICLLVFGFGLWSIASLYFFKKPLEISRVGISLWNNEADLVSAIKGFKEGLAESGFYEGKNVRFILKQSNGSIENLINNMELLVQSKVNVIFTLTTPGAIVAKGITTRIPVVFFDVEHPEKTGLINFLLKTNSNLVGVQTYVSPAQQYYQFESLYPGTKVLGFVHQKSDADSDIQYQEYKEMLSRRNIKVIDIAALDNKDLLNQLQQQRPHYNALFIGCDDLIKNGGGKIAANFILQNKIPSFSCDKDSVLAGVLVGYFADLYAGGKLAGKKAALILRGAEPGWLHAEFPVKSYLIVNLKTAKLLGIKTPVQTIQSADAVVK